MLQEAQNEPPEPGNLLVVIERDAEENEKEQEVEEGNDPHANADRPEPEMHRNPPPIHDHRSEETYQAYLMLATMLKYLNNGNAFSENHLED